MIINDPWVYNMALGILRSFHVVSRLHKAEMLPPLPGPMAWLGDAACDDGFQHDDASIPCVNGLVIGNCHFFLKDWGTYLYIYI